MWDKLKWLALVPSVLFLTLAVLALLEQRWPGLVKSLLMALFFFTVPFWPGPTPGRRTPETRRGFCTAAALPNAPATDEPAR